MSAGRYDITADQYATFSLPLTWQDASGATINLTGYTALMQVRDSTGALIIELSTTDGRIVVGAAAPNIVLGIAAPDVEALPAQGAAAWSYDLLLTSPGGVVTRLLAGSFAVAPGVSKPGT